MFLGLRRTICFAVLAATVLAAAAPLSAQQQPQPKKKSGITRASRSLTLPARGTKIVANHTRIVTRNGGRDGRLQPIRARLAKVTVGEVAVRARRGGAGRTLAYIPRDQYIAVVAQAEGYLGLMMEDGTIGWVNEIATQPMDYEFTLFRKAEPVAAPRQRTALTSASPVNRFSPLAEDTARYMQSAGAEIVLPAHARPLLEEAVTYLGVPYLWGGTSRNGLDCSAFVQNVFGTQGVRLPRTAAMQSGVGAPVAWENLQPGDRLYFTMRKSYVSHCGIYIAGGWFIHSSTNHRGVAVDSIYKPGYYTTLVAIRRSL